MSEYYAIERSSEYLAHYGVKGMKWGVRKAIESGNSKRLAKHYAKALKKIKKLNTKASISRSKDEYKSRMADAGTWGVSGGLSAALGAGVKAYEKAKGVRVLAGPLWAPPIAPLAESALLWGGVSGGAGAYQLARAMRAKHRTTAKGHAKAKAKADAFRKEMKTAFRKTKYAKLPGANSMNKSRLYEKTGTQLKNAAIDSVTRPGYSMSRNSAREISANNNRHGRKRRKSK